MTDEMAAPEPTEAELVARFAAGDQQAARDLTARLAPRIHALARRMLNDRTEAEDVTQEAMLRLWRMAPRWRDEGNSVSTWLYRVAGNLCIDRLRRRREVSASALPERLAGALDAHPDGAPAAQARLEADERATALRDALETLPDRQRLAIVLRHLEERPNPEIAAILETSVEA
jgi:RNA polymerase sigma-70 factor (ECF subfamily)